MSEADKPTGPQLEIVPMEDVHHHQFISTPVSTAERFANVMLDDVEATKVERLLIVWSVLVGIDFICVLRYVFLPITLIYLFGGPFFIIVPWTFWAWLILMAQIALLIRPIIKYNEPSILKDWYYKIAVKIYPQLSVPTENTEFYHFFYRPIDTGLEVTVSIFDQLASCVSTAI